MMKWTYRKLYALGSLAACVGVVPFPAFAQDAAARDGTENRADLSGGEIMVTAQKREQRLQDVPMAISALSGDALRKIGATNFEDFARTVPGLIFPIWAQVRIA